MGKRVLVVDDEEDILKLERVILSRQGYELTLARGATEALELLAGATFDLVLLDVMMPGMDGLELCRRLKEDPRHAAMPVIFLTARGGGAALAEGLASGAAMYIQKPFTATKLLAVVSAAFEAELTTPEPHVIADDPTPVPRS